MAECILCYENQVCNGCSRCVLKWCKECNYKLDSCPMCRMEIVSYSELLKPFSILFSTLFYFFGFYLIPIATYLFILDELILRVNQDTPILLLIFIQLVSTMSLIGVAIKLMI